MTAAPVSRRVFLVGAAAALGTAAASARPRPAVAALDWAPGRAWVGTDAWAAGQ